MKLAVSRLRRVSPSDFVNSFIAALFGAFFRSARKHSLHKSRAIKDTAPSCQSRKGNLFRTNRLFGLFGSFVALATFLQLDTTNAEVSYTPSRGPGLGTIRVFGNITPQDVDTFVRAGIDSKAHCNGCEPGAFITLDSDGGDVDAAIAMGRAARGWLSTIFVQEGSHCYSACVILLAGGASRGAYGKIGIHRPFTINAPPSQTLTEAQAIYRQLTKRVHDYLVEMNMPPALFDTMMAIDASKIRMLSLREAEAFGLAGTDPAIEDYETSKGAASYGLSKEVYLTRFRRLNQICQQQDPAERGTCFRDVMAGRR